MDVYQIYCGNPLPKYTYIESLCFIPETDGMSLCLKKAIRGSKDKLQIYLFPETLKYDILKRAFFCFQ